MIFVFGEFELDIPRYQLRRDGRVIKLEPRVFSLLHYLIRHRDRVVTKRELLDNVWAETSVSEAVLPNAVRAIRRALGQARGTDEPIATEHSRGYRFTAPVTVQMPAPAQEPKPEAHEPFVGRKPVMEPLLGALGAACERQGSVVFLEGDAGMGKSRAAEELARQAKGRGVVVSWGRCSEQHGAPAFWPWIQVLRATMGRLPEVLQDALSSSSTATGTVEAEAAVPASDEDLERESALFRLYDEVATVLFERAGAGPHVVILEDMHWADQPSFELLRFIAESVADKALMIVATLRAMELPRSDPKRPSFRALARLRTCRRIALTPLTKEDIAEYARGITNTPIPEALVREIHAKSGGNPFFMTEIVRFLQGKLDGAMRDDRSRLPAVGVPEVVRDVIRRRLDQLDAELREVLSLASVAGEEFALSILAHASQRPAKQVVEILDRAEAVRLVARREDASGSHYAFGHVLFRDTLYTDLSRAERSHMHQRIAASIEVLQSSLEGQHLKELAYHFNRALPQQPDKAFEYACLAARSERRLYAYDEAAELYGWALEALDFLNSGDPMVDGKRRAEIWIRTGRAQLGAGRADKARVAFDNAVRLARQVQDPGLYAEAVVALRRSSGNMRGSSLLSLLEQALADLGDDAPSLRARLESWIARDGSFSPEERRRRCQRALQLARDHLDPGAIEVFRTCLDNLRGPDDLDMYQEVTGEVLQLARHHGPYWDWVGHWARCLGHLQVCDVQAADRDLDTCRRLARELRSPGLGAECRLIEISRTISDGRFDEAGRAINALFREPSPRTRRQRQIVWSMQFFRLMRESTRLGSLQNESLIRGVARTAVQELGLPASFAESNVALFFLARGDDDEARRRYESLAADDFAQVPRREEFLSTLADAAALSAHFEDARRAAVLYELLSPYAERNTLGYGFYYSGSVHHALGLLAATSGREEQAEAHFESALAKNAHMGARPAVARTRLAFASMLLRYDSAEQRDRAMVLVEQARDEAKTLDMPGLLSQLERTATSLYSRRPSPNTPVA